MLDKLLKSKKLLISVLVGIVALLGIYLFTKSSDTPSKSNPVTLTIWHVYGGQTISPMNDCIQEFNKTVGKDNGITVKVTSISDSKNIEQALLASFNKEPGSAALPNLFVAYPRLANHIGPDNLLPWDQYLPKESLNTIYKDFLKYGTLNGKLYVLPIAPSSEMVFVNESMFNRFSQATGHKLADLETTAGFFKTAEDYYTWSNGSQFAAVDDLYNYLFVTTTALGNSFIKDAKLDCSSDEFSKAWEPMARAAIHGGLATNRTYASSMRKTGDIAASLSSTAALLYLSNYVTKKDNTREAAEYAFASYPLPQGSQPTALIRGGGLQAFRDKSELKNKAMAIFANWLTRQEANNPFVYATGYMPVNIGAPDNMLKNLKTPPTPRQQRFYSTMKTMLPDRRMVATPVFKDSDKIQRSFDKTCKELLEQAHNEYLQSDKSEAVMQLLISRTQVELGQKFAS